MSAPLPQTDSPAPPLTVPTGKLALEIGLGYAALGLLWLGGSGWVLERLVQDRDLEKLLRQVAAGGFIVVSAAVLVWALARYFQQIRSAAGSLHASEERLRLRTVEDFKRTESALQKSASEFRAIFENASVGMAQSDPVTGRWLRVNERLCAITGYSAEELLRMEVAEVTYPEDRPYHQRLWQRVIAGETPDCRLEERYRRKDGSLAWVDVHMAVIRDANGRLLSTLATIEDITGRRQLENQLRQAQKLEAIGQLAGGVAHDFNNILAAMLLQAGLLQQDPDLGPAARDGLRELETAAQRAANLTRQLLMFSRRSVMSFRVLDLNEVVANLLKMLRRLIGEHIVVSFEASPSLPPVEADPGLLEQVLMNLAVNARDAMPTGGQLSIGTSSRIIHESDVPRNPNMRPGRFVCLSVADTGVGMDDATRSRLFEPFFTTKELGKGTGLGLATVHGIVAQHKGWVEVESEVGQGTTFRVFLPALEPAPETITHDHSPPLRAPHRGTTILLVEDESTVRHMLAISLRRLGYTPLEAADGRAALKIWETEKANVDLLLTDMVMPEGITGIDLAQRFQGERPELKVIISTGYSSEITQESQPPHINLAYLPKPFDAKTLARVLSSCLGS